MNPITLLSSIRMGTSEDSAHKMNDTMVNRSRLDIDGDLTINDSIIYKPSITLRIDEQSMQNQFVRELLGTGFTEKRPETASATHEWKLPFDTVQQSSAALGTIRDTVRGQIAELKRAHRKIAAKVQVNAKKKQSLHLRIDQLRNDGNVQANQELARLESTIRIMEQFEEMADAVAGKISEMTALLRALTALQEEDRLHTELYTIGTQVEDLLGAAIRIANETQDLLGTSSQLR